MSRELPVPAATDVDERLVYRSPRLRADLHCHTHHSPDSRSRPEDLIRACASRGVTCLAITDHDEIAGALELADLVARTRAPLRVIIGEEVKTTRGEIIGYFLRERVPPRLTPAETVARIRAQGGLVAVPHPFDRLRGSRLDRAALDEILPEIDVLEVWNARIHLPADVRAAADFATKASLASSAGSDSHVAWEIGGAGVELADFDGPAEFLASLRQGTLFGRSVTPLVHVASTLSKFPSGLRKKLQNRSDRRRD